MPNQRTLMKSAFDLYANMACCPDDARRSRADKAAVWFWGQLTYDEKVELEKTRRHVIEHPKKKRVFEDACRKARRRLFK